MYCNAMYSNLPRARSFYVIMQPLFVYPAKTRPLTERLIVSSNRM